VRLLALFLLAAMSSPALADDADAAALLLADKTTMTAEQSSDWHVYVEAAAREARERGANPSLHGTRTSIDARFDRTFAPGWRAVFADRLDMNRMNGASGNQDINTLKEAYLSWQAQPDRIADLGRINARNGVAFGYNPTDTFRAGALRSIVSLDPASLRENRLGSVMLRGQQLWDGGALTALYSPKLADKPSNADFSPDFGATNRRARWQLALSEKLSEALNPQWLLSGGAGLSPQLGLNLTALTGDATVAYVEWSGGRAPSLAAQSLMSPDDTAFRSRVSTGLTYTTPDNISFTAEYEYNGAGLDRDAWNTLRRGSPAAYGLYRNFVANLQELPTRDNLFLYAIWKDALVKNLDLTAMVRHDLVDHSRLQWLEMRYHWTRVDVALQTQLDTGQAGSNYGALPDRRLWQAVARYFF
jgi:opacity protein-like surface antigen